ncbi:hypothetical protein KIPB_015954, partial [Kipferlia bialata]|eukprot:g15954.t1
MDEIDCYDTIAERQILCDPLDAEGWIGIVEE